MLLSLEHLSQVRLRLANLIDWLISLVHKFRLVNSNKHQHGEILVTACNCYQL